MSPATSSTGRSIDRSSPGLCGRRDAGFRPRTASSLSRAVAVERRADQVGADALRHEILPPCHGRPTAQARRRSPSARVTSTRRRRRSSGRTDPTSPAPRPCCTASSPDAQKRLSCLPGTDSSRVPRRGDHARDIGALFTDRRHATQYDVIERTRVSSAHCGRARPRAFAPRAGSA